MTTKIENRWQIAATGAIGGLLLWLVVEGAERGLIGDRWALVLAAFVGTGFGAALAMAGPIGLWRALPRALGLAAVTAVLVWLGGLRFEDGIFGSGLSVLAAVMVATLPVPFLIAAARGGWRDYPALFLEAWSIAVRLVAAAAFTALVWAVIYLSDAVLGIVGITVIADLLEHWVVPMVVSGAVLGLGVAVIHELADYVSPYLVLRLFRLLLPVVLGVMLVFLVALPFRGLTGLFSGLSPALLLLTMVGVGISLVAIAVDQTDAEATQSAVVIRAAQGMALILPVLACLAGWAIWLRVAQHGWTPERLFAALVAGTGLVYGLTYAAAVLRGAGWMERIRQGNLQMALAVILLAALWLTPILNAERISANDQLRRYDDGRTPLADLDIRAFGQWGRPGAAVLATLDERARSPGQEALADRLAGRDIPAAASDPATLSALVTVLALQPPGASGTRDTLLAGAMDYQLDDWARTCTRDGVADQPRCLMVVADLMPGRPGEEAMLLLDRGGDYVEVLGLYLDDQGHLMARPPLRADGRSVTGAEAMGLLRAWTDVPPPVTPALINQLGTGEAGLIVLP
ncbi:MAG: DUF4153 domain-containing protein [Rhodobacterales bacterium]|nr:DUF4153 domain-containing protein [Rhodobacterales bacterium]